ncbi:MAG: hypothetical protein ACFB10_26695, partial [Salibacteraceae bacterium]
TPFENRLAIPLPSGAQQQVTVMLFDARGKQVFQQAFQVAEGYSELEMNTLSALPSGSYLYVVNAPEGMRLLQGSLLKH